MQIAGQKAKLFPRLHSRAGQDDAADLLALERRDRHGDGQVRFACAGRADADGHGIVADGLDILLLPEGLTLYRLALVGYGHGIARGGHDLFCLAAGCHLYGLADSPIVDGFPFRYHPLQGFQRLSRSPARFRFAAHLHLLIAGVDGYIQRALNQADVGIVRAKDRHQFIQGGKLHQFYLPFFRFQATAPLPFFRAMHGMFVLLYAPKTQLSSMVCKHRAPRAN